MTASDRVLPVATGGCSSSQSSSPSGVVVVVLTLPFAEETTASAPLAAVDAAANGSAIDVCHREGDVILAADLAVRYARPDAAAVVRPFSSGATADADSATVAAGECRPVTPPVEGDPVRFVLRHTPSNLTLVDEWVSVGWAAGG